MITGITKDKHFITDYSYVPLVMAAPRLVGFEEEKWASRICFVLSTTVLGYSLLTDAKWGAIRVIPYKTHAALDLATGIFCMAYPVFTKVANKKARNTILLMGITGLVVGTLSLIGATKSR